LSDPLSEVVLKLKPKIVRSKLIEGSGTWCVQRSEFGQPFYCAVLHGHCQLVMSGQDPIALQAGDFVLIPAAFDFAMASTQTVGATTPDTQPTKKADGRYTVGKVDGKIDVHLMIGHCEFISADVGLLTSLLPTHVHVKADMRLSALVRLVSDEAHSDRPGRSLVLTRLLEVLVFEALRSVPTHTQTPGLLRGLGDSRIGVAIRRIHDRPESAWTIAQLAKLSSLSRSSFFSRFSEVVGMTPMAYLQGWRMSLAEDLLVHQGLTVAQVAERIGYGSASAFSVAFSRHFGVSPASFTRISRRTAIQKNRDGVMTSRTRVAS
jgi:AraC-like DNA-binding protein